jgi:hypothetical protein
MPIEITKEGTTICTGEGIEVFRLAQLLTGLRFEQRTPGMRMSSRTPKATTIARKLYGLKGNADKLIAQVEKLLEQAKQRTTYVHEE